MEKQPKRRRPVWVEDAIKLRYLLRLKEQLILRNTTFRREAAELTRAVPSQAAYERLGSVRQRSLQARCDAFARRWGCTHTRPWDLADHPCGGSEVYFPTRGREVVGGGVFVVSVPKCPILFLALDLGHDAEYLLGQLRVVLTGERKLMRAQAKIGAEPLFASRKGYRYGDAFLVDLQEAIRVWDMREEKQTMADIAAHLFRGKSMGAALQAVKRRHRLAQRLIEREGFRDILPFSAHGAWTKWIEKAFEGGTWRE